MTINKLIHQKDGNGIKNLSNVFNEELLVSKSSEVTEESLPLLLLQVSLLRKFIIILYFSINLFFFSFI